MVFSSCIFLFFFLPIVSFVYWLCPNLKGKNAILILASLLFYAFGEPVYILLMIGSILVNYALARLIASGRRGTKGILAFTVVFNIGMLVVFKYSALFVETAGRLLGIELPVPDIALPIGISFYTFQALSYCIDVYRDKSIVQKNVWKLMLYISFFPQLIAGPIVYHDELIPQLRARENHRIQYGNLCRGMYAFALGMAKKVLAADTLSKVVTIGYDNVGALNSISTILVMLCYSLQIYFDFSGYCDMAYGIGYMFNVELPVNFNSPYKAASVREFWDRWHMTLTRFFTKYVYIPLGGSRKGKARTYLNVMAVFLVSGIWHGANWTFILWGIVNGLGSLYDRLFDRILQKIPRAIRIAVTFCFCTIAWSMFRAESVGQGLQMIGNLARYGDGKLYGGITESFNQVIEVRLLGRLGLRPVILACPWVMPVVFAAVLVLACLLLRNTQEKVHDGRYGAWRVAVTVVLLIWSILSLSEVSEFLYFNF